MNFDYFDSLLRAWKCDWFSHGDNHSKINNLKEILGGNLQNAMISPQFLILYLRLYVESRADESFLCFLTNIKHSFKFINF